MTPSVPLTAVLIGAGDRGNDPYGRYALDHPRDLRFVAVAEPQPDRRAAFARAHGIPAERCFSSWEPLLALERLATVAFVCTPDQTHSAPGLAALERGYHVLLEKPMATTAAECRRLVEAAEQHGRQLQVSHVMRYAPFFQSVQQAIRSGQLGDIICLSQRENVSYYHMAHSFVRGNWRSSRGSNPMILAKCCHDLDLLQWLVGAPARAVSSFGNLLHFRPEHAPAGAPLRCADGCPAEPTCIYSALDIYVRLTPILRIGQLSRVRSLRWLATLMERYPDRMEAVARVIPALRTFTEYSGWPVRVMSDEFTRAGRLRAVQEPDNPYGRCVYHCDNDVVDHQHVDIEFENGVTATLIMHGHSYAEGRSLRIDGSDATLIGEMYEHHEQLLLHEKRTGRVRRLFEQKLGLDHASHGGGDAGLMQALIGALRGGLDRAALGADLVTGARGALESHLMAFAAEQSRLEGRVVLMEALRSSGPATPGS